MAKHICRKDWRFKVKTFYSSWFTGQWEFYYPANLPASVSTRKAIAKKGSRKKNRQYEKETALNGSDYKKLSSLGWYM